MIIWAGMATVRERVKGRILSSESLIQQVDRLTICPGDETGDIIKFASCGDAPDDSIFVCVDDDLIYPPYFVSDLYMGLCRYPNSIVGFHGWMITPEATRGRVYPCLGDVDYDHEVDVIGTGACAWNTNTIRITPEECPAFGADIWLSIKAEKLGVRRFVLPHERGYFGYEAPRTTIWNETVARSGSKMDVSEVISSGCRTILSMR